MSEKITKKPTFAYHPWLMSMECRKDILIENQYINEKARIAVTPKKTRILSLLKDNKMRIYYFFGFCLLFSLDKVYDAIVYGNRFYPKLSRTFQFKDKINSIEQQRKLRFSPSDEKVKRLGDIFIKYDEVIPINKKLMEQVKREPYEEPWVDSVEFINTFYHSDVEQLEGKIRQFMRGHSLIQL